MFGACLAVGGVIGGLGGGVTFDLLGSGSSSGGGGGISGGSGSGSDRDGSSSGSGGNGSGGSRWSSLCRGMLLSGGVMACGTALVVVGLAAVPSGSVGGFWALFTIGIMLVLALQVGVTALLGMLGLRGGVGWGGVGWGGLFLSALDARHHVGAGHWLLGGGWIWRCR